MNCELNKVAYGNSSVGRLSFGEKKNVTFKSMPPMKNVGVDLSLLYIIIKYGAWLWSSA